MNDAALLRALTSLLQPIGGMFSSVSPPAPSSAEPRFATRVVHLNSSARRYSAVNDVAVQRHEQPIFGAGSAIDEDHALLLALMEGLERYSASVFSSNQFRLSSANDLDTEAIDLNSIPRCSDTELSDTQCPLTAPNKQAPIRWVKALSVLDGRIVFVPAIMAYTIARYTSAAERIWLPISTGCAAHTSFEGALWRAVLEVVERDIISVLWLQQLALPRIEIDHVPDGLIPYWREYAKSSCDLEYMFFDATSDIGIPTVYGLQRSPHDRQITTLVTCCTDVDPVRALAKAMRDMGAARIALTKVRHVPERWQDFRQVLDGASYMARAEHVEAFNFLTTSPRSIPLSDMDRLASTTDRETLLVVLDRLQKRQMDIYAVDISSDEAIRCGVRVVRAIIPGLQPLSFHYRARFLAHRRLYELPVLLGYTSHTEEELNRWPQPFG